MAVTVGWVYGIVDPITSELRYVGQTINYNKRKGEHLYKAKTNRTSNHLYNWLGKLIANNVKPEFIIIDKVPIESLDYWEVFYISYFKSIGCNLTNYAEGGNSRGGFTHSEEFKQYLSHRYKGRNPWNTGKKLSKEHKRNISNNHRNPTDYSPWYTARSKRKVNQISLEGTLLKTWDSAYEASKILGIGRKNIGNVLSKYSKTAGGYKWEYL